MRPQEPSIQQNYNFWGPSAWLGGAGGHVWPSSLWFCPRCSGTKHLRVLCDLWSLLPLAVISQSLLHIGTIGMYCISWLVLRPNITIMYASS